jgi:two-component system, OmpR family, phosphate regulon sensor histidine kinase PhoR
VLKIRVNFIVALVIIALLALLIIQAFQTAQLYDRKATRFEDNLTTSLERIANRHEKAEDIRRYMHIVDRDFSGQYKDILKEEFRHLVDAQESISIQDTAIMVDGRMDKFLVIKGQAFDTISGLKTEQRVLARDVRHIRELLDKQRDQVLSHNRQAKLAIQLDQRVMQQIFKKAKFINEMMIQAFRDNVYEDPTKRIDVFFMDSVIHTELANDDLPKKYKFMITDEFGQPLKFDSSPANYKTSLDTLRTGKTLLFPSNSLDDNLYLHIFFPDKGAYLFQEMFQSFMISLTLILLIVVALMFMFRTIISQHRLSELKNDFISNMTHEFKTPISTISLACEALNDKDMLKTTDDISPFVSMISTENKRLGVLVESILQSAVLDKGRIKLKKERINLSDCVEQLITNAQFRVQGQDGVIHLNLPKEPVFLDSDKMHLTNVLSNLIDNAIKYSKDKPEITVTLKKEQKTVYFSVKDNGIGIEREHLGKIFDKLYRIPTGNVHNVKGFGLGLSYVKAICDLNDWKVSVSSKLGEGSEFTIKMTRV